MILILFLSGVLGQAATQASPQNFTAQASPQDFATDRILVKFKTSALAADRQTVHARQHGTVIREISRLGIQVVQVPAGTVAQKIQAYQGESAVEFAEPDFIVKAIGVPNDTYYANQWGMTRIQAPQAWDVTTGNSTIIIAILDTGVDQNHEDLAAKIESNKNFTTSNTTDDLYGHGTHVAGIAAAITNNALGVAGVGYNSRIMNVKVLDDDGNGSASEVANGIIWAADNGAKVINLSFGSNTDSQTVHNAIDYAWSLGVVIVAAAGNDSTNTPRYPAYYSNSIAVAATDNNDVIADFSNYGSWVDVAAPGKSIFSTLPNHTNSLGLNYGYESGSSMAAPYVAGLAALLWATPYGSSNNSAVIRNLIESTADNISGTGTNWQFGRINAYQAVRIPLVTTDNTTNITTTGARLNGNLSYLGGAASANVSFQWGLTSGNYTAATTVQTTNATGAFYFDLGSLSPGTTHYFRARAVGQDTGYGTEKTFTTLRTPSVTTDNASNVSYFSARLNGTLESRGVASSANVSFMYGATSGNLTIPTEIIAMNLPGAFSANITGLSTNTTYYFRARAVGDGTSYGTEKSFTTLPPAPPVVVTDNATNVSFHTARLNGSLDSLSSASSANVSFIYSATSGNLTIPTEIIAMNLTGAFSANITGLSTNTTYYFRARAVGDGTSYGTEKSLTTLTPPSVTTANATGIGSFSAWLNGNLVSLGTASSANVSFEYGSSSGNYTQETFLPTLNAPGPFSAFISSISSGTIWYFRAKAVGIDGYGTAYGEERSFTTSIPPEVTTDNATNITTNSSRLIGTLASLGTVSSANVSFQYGTTSGNLTFGTEILLMNLTGAFSSNLTSLTPGTTYYFRAKVTGDTTNWTSYGIVKSFATLTTPPSVTTANATNITINSALVSGNLTSLGTANSANISFQSGTTSSNLTFETEMVLMSLTGAFSASITGLSTNTTYYFRAKGVGDGTSYGTEKSFTTLSTPSVTTDGSSSVTTNSATLSGSLTSMGTATTVNASFEYGTTTAYANSVTTQSVLSPGSFVANITGLVAGTQYHFRAKTDGGASGVSYGVDRTFTTSSPSGGGGGGGGGGGDVSASSARVDLTGFTSSGAINLNSSGATTAPYVVQSADKNCTIQIAGGTKLVDASGTPLTSLTHSTPSALPDAPANVDVLSAQELGPSGARFEPAISLTLTYDKTKLSAGADEVMLYIAFWDGTNWMALPTVLDATLSKATVSVTHFTIFAVMVPTPVPPALPVTPLLPLETLPITPSAPVVPTPQIVPALPVETPPITSPTSEIPTPPTALTAPALPAAPEAAPPSPAAPVTPTTPAPAPTTPTTPEPASLNWIWYAVAVIGLILIVSIIFMRRRTIPKAK